MAVGAVGGYIIGQRVGVNKTISIVDRNITELTERLERYEP